MYWGASVEFQTPLFFAPKEVGIKLAAFADAGSLWNYRRPDLVAPAGAGRDRRDAQCRRATACS